MFKVFFESREFKQLSSAAADDAFDCGCIDFSLVRALLDDGCVMYDIPTGDAYATSSEIQRNLDYFCTTQVSSFC